MNEPAFRRLQARDEVRAKTAFDGGSGLLGLQPKFVVDVQIIQHRLQLSRKETVLTPPERVLTIKHSTSPDN